MSDREFLDVDERGRLFRESVSSVMVIEGAAKTPLYSGGWDSSEMCRSRSTLSLSVIGICDVSSVCDCV